MGLLKKSEQGSREFNVRTKEGVFRSGHDKQEEADYACKEANKAAEELGIETRYTVQAR